MKPSRHHNPFQILTGHCSPGREGKRLQTRTRQTFWDKMHLAKVIERPFLDWDKVEW